MKAAGLGRDFYIERLLELGVKVNTTDPRGRNAAYYARMYEYNETADLLEEKIAKD
jgi:hypothetical protein